MTPNKLNKSQLNKLLEQVTNDVAIMLKSDTEETTLSKADPGEETTAETTPDGSATDGPPGEESSASPEDTGAPEGSAPPMDGGPDGSQDPATDAGATPEALQAEYMKLPPEELKMHLMAAHAALMAMESQGGGPEAGGPEASAGPPGPDASAGPPPGPEASAGGPPPGAGGPPPGIGKGEISTGTPNDNNGGMAKSQMSEISKLRKSIKEKDEQLAKQELALTDTVKAITDMITKRQVMRKSVSGISYISKPGTTEKPAEKAAVDPRSLTKSQVMEKLNKVTASTKLAKSDREIINKFVVGSAGIDDIAKYLA
jgi:hypothetical protein